MNLPVTLNAAVLPAVAMAQASPEVIDRIPSAYSNFVIPFVVGMVFFLCWITIGCIRIFMKIGPSDQAKFWKSLVNPVILAKNVKDLFFDCLFHVKIWKRNPLLGYMHSAIAFGWFMLIVLGHIEVALFVPKHLSPRAGGLFYPIFYRYFVWINPGHETLRGSFFFFLMDFFLLYVLSGIALAVFKRFRSIVLGMKHTTKPSTADRLALYSLWLIFPLRLLAESFTADLSGGSFLTLGMNHFLHFVFGDRLYFQPFWWAYSICLGVFFATMPFTRYMHILTEVLWILFRNAGLQPAHPRKGVAEAEIYACSSCGLCLDACPMNVQRKNLGYSSVYFIRFLRRHNERKINDIADKCLMCGKCLALCPVSVDAPALRRAQRRTVNDSLPYDYSYLRLAPAAIASARGPSADTVPADETPKDAAPQVMYFAGCMSHLTPRIIKAVEGIFKASGTKYIFADRNGGICCGRPLLLAGKTDAASKVIETNRRMIWDSGCKTLVLSCPICFKVFSEEYSLKGTRVVHYTQFVKELIDSGRLKVHGGGKKYVYHDPCELGRGMGVYAEPRDVLGKVGELVPAGHERKESLCCGGSLGSLTLNLRDRDKITEAAVSDLTTHSPEAIVTACPLCLGTFSRKSPVKVRDFAETVLDNLDS
jgi:Fe-S oxidoreductase